ncbi:uncharacterized protein LOC122258443 [Penaeus japonicus]|uniref:uncharacterized protein LOC122258443 n=1 Tax=Penaeus japonicus TaxID=27405 RepID=UPI001C70FAF0|nr:uncharacterized protein LOC122258443 [Penaeus japonicus]
MKTLAILLVCVALASATRFGLGGQGQRPLQQRVIDWGPKVYGPGAKNQFALQPNPLLMQRALQIANLDPNLLVYLDLDGTIEFRDRFGNEPEEHPHRFDFTQLLDI